LTRDNVAYDTVHTGAPILRDCLTWFDCSVHQRLEVGDHIVLIGRIEAFGTSPSAPLGFCRSRYAEVKDPLPPGWSPSRNMIVGYIIEGDGRILLRATGEDKMEPADRQGSAEDHAARSRRRGNRGTAAGHNLSLFDLRRVGR
jgi:hypothetical protein